MITKPTYFSLDELVCPHVYNHFGEIAWGFFDSKLLVTIDRIRELLNKPIFVNNWKDGPTVYFDERGFRCIQCDLVKKAIAENRLYCSPHMRGQAIDCDIQGLVSSEVREWLIKNQNLLPYPIRLENNVSWVHIDVVDNFEGKKVTLFNP